MRAKFAVDDVVLCRRRRFIEFNFHAKLPQRISNLTDHVAKVCATTMMKADIVYLPAYAVCVRTQYNSDEFEFGKA